MTEVRLSLAEPSHVAPDSSEIQPPACIKAMSNLLHQLFQPVGTHQQTFDQSRGQAGAQLAAPLVLILLLLTHVRSR